jgi:hypothetical protein
MSRKTHIRVNARRLNLIEREQGDALLEARLITEQGRSDLLVLDNDVEKLAAGADLECGRRSKVLLGELDQVGDEPLDLGPVKVGMGVAVREVGRREARLEPVALLTTGQAVEGRGGKIRTLATFAGEKGVGTGRLTSSRPLIRCEMSALRPSSSRSRCSSPPSFSSTLPSSAFLALAASSSALSPSPSFCALAALGPSALSSRSAWSIVSLACSAEVVAAERPARAWAIWPM